MEEQTPTPEPSLFQRMKHRLTPEGVPADDRGRMRMVMESLILHIHPAKVETTSMKWTYTWGLGGLSALLMAILGGTGIILINNYTPAAPQAYLDILEINSNVWFGELIRNLHHWSANLLIVVTVLHLIRVFVTGAYRPPRELNWLIGVAMLLLVIGANFTGYLLPWDQLAYWAITVGTSIISYVPLVGQWLSQLILGGPEVGANTLLNFYSMHISFIPLAIFGLMSYHFWRVRKDGGLTIPKSSKQIEDPKPERVTTIPNLTNREMIFALAWTAALLLFSMLVPAPLEGIANPALSPNPAKAPWYFMGLQELLLHFHPLVGAIIIPSLAIAGIFLLPFFDLNLKSYAVRSKFIDRVDEHTAQIMLDRLHASTAANPIAEFRVLGGAMARVSPEATAFAHRSSRVMASFIVQYEDREEAGIHNTWVSDSLAALDQGTGAVYVNFVADEGQARLHDAYPAATWERLAAIKAKYDPTNLFRRNHNIKPIIG